MWGATSQGEVSLAQGAPMADHTLEQLQRVREQIARVIARGDLSKYTHKAMQETLESVDRDIAVLKAKRTG
jgi:Trk K+ transport system NAD-binding subunit